MGDDERELPGEFIALAGAVVIGLGRIYDVLLSIYTEQNPDRAVKLLERHREGKLFFPPPSIAFEEEGGAGE